MIKQKQLGILLAFVLLGAVGYGAYLSGILPNPLTDDASEMIRMVENGQFEALKSLDKSELRFKARNDTGLAPLHIASSNGDAKIVRYLLEKGASVHIRSKARLSHGYTALHLASSRGNADVVKALLEHGAELNIRATKFNQSRPLHLAVIKGHAKVTEILLEDGADVNAERKVRRPGTPASFTPLDYAEQLGRTRVVEILKQHGGTHNYPTRPHPLLASAGDGDVDRLRSQLESGVDIEQSPDTGPFAGYTALHVASMGGKKRVVDFLVKRGGNLNAQTIGMQFTPLYLSLMFGHNRIADFLLTNGADPNIASANGYSPLHLAVANGNHKATEQLITAGAKVNARTPDGHTPLHSAVSHGPMDVSQLLVNHGANLNAKDSKGWTPLAMAVSGDHLNVLKYLVKQGADPTLENNYGWTLLHLAVTDEGDKDITKYLLEHGLNPSTTTNNGKTTVELAREAGNDEIVELLQQYND